MANRFAVVLRRPGAPGFSGAGVLARFELAMGSLGVVLLVTGTGGSYSLATLLTASHALATAVFGTWTSRLVDRYGQRSVLLPQTSVYVPAVLGLVLGVTHRAPAAVLLGLAVLEGAAHPMVTQMVRARWAAMLRGTGELRTAFAWESMLDAAIIALGAPLATFLAAYLFPAAALLVAICALTVSAVVLATLRDTEPMILWRPVRSRWHGVEVPAGILLLAAISFFVGADLGSFDIAAIARANEAAWPQLAGWILAVYAVGSTLGGTLIGRYGSSGSLALQYAVVLGMLSLGVVPMLFVSSAGWLVMLAFAAGFFIAPTIILGMTVTEALAPLGRITESMAWVGAASIVGRALGQLITGRVVDRGGANAGFVVTFASAAVACVLALAFIRRLTALMPRCTRLTPVEPLHESAPELASPQARGV